MELNIPDLPTGFQSLDKILVSGFKLYELALTDSSLPFYKSDLFNHCKLKIILESAGDKQFEFNTLNQSIDQIAPELDP